jgi:regulatory protein
MTSDGDRLAPVTWLFGSPDEQPAPVAAAPSSAPVPVPTTSNGTDERGRFQRINNVSMNALARRGMSTEEMRDYLGKRGFDENETELECERLVGVGLLDDFALAETLIRILRQRKGLGRSALVAELRRRRLDTEAIDAALEDLDDDELARAIDLAVKRAPQLRSLDDQTARRRLGAFLMRKGYSGGVVQAAVDRALSAPRSGTGPFFA